MSRFTWYYTPKELNRALVHLPEVQASVGAITEEHAGKARAALAARSDGRRRMEVTVTRGGKRVDWYINLKGTAKDVNVMSAEQGTKQGGWGQAGTSAAAILHKAFNRFTLPLSPLTRSMRTRNNRRGRILRKRGS